MEKFEIIITTLFGLESLVAREVRRLGYETTSVEDGRVTFMGDNEATYECACDGYADGCSNVSADSGVARNNKSCADRSTIPTQRLRLCR